MYSSILHDIGKIDFYDKILNRVDELSEVDRNQIKKHPITAYNMLSGVEFLKDCAEVILQHHERFDGKGYPYGVEADKINKLARIISLADSFEAMISDRIYKKGKDINQVVKEIEANKGTQFDPEIADIVLQIIRDSNCNLEEYIKNEQRECSEDNKNI
jgi:HD-GYP domain-containing protein (c-di-GMP phosphodiesterase class II)